MKKWIIVISFLTASVCSAATINFTYTDGPGEGFNSTDPGLASSTIAGDLGTQRRGSFQAAVNEWAANLTSSITINVTAEMNPQSCSASGAILGSAGTTNIYRNFPGATFADTWYHSALADKLAAADQGGGAADIFAQFNSDIDNNPNCLGDGGMNSVNWYYHTANTNPPANHVAFYDTVLHEIAHGLGVSSFVNSSTGALNGGFIGIYSRFLEDHSLGLTWNNMNDAQRAASAIDTADLHWVGPVVNAKAATFTFTDGYSNGHVEMYAPNPLEPGSSVSHFSSDFLLDDGTNELMEPSASFNSLIKLTDELLEDIGWGSTLPVELESFEIE